MNFVVLGFRRSGTTYVSELIKTHPNAKCLIEPLTLNVRIFAEHEFSYWTDEDFVPSVYHRLFSTKPLVVEFLRDLRRWLSLLNCKTALGFKEVTLHSKILWLREFVPDIKLIYLTRDPRNVIASFKKLGFGQRWDYATKVQVFMNQKEAPFRVELPSIGIPDRDILVSCLAFKISTLYYLNLPKSVRAMRVKLEDLLDDPVSVTSDIMNYIGLETHKRQIGFLKETTSITRGGSYSKYRTKADVNDRFNILTPAELETIGTVLREERKLLGYD